MIGILTVHLRLPGCSSLKEKRSYIKPLLARLHRKFNLSVAELGLQDDLDHAVLACAIVGNDRRFLQAALANVETWIGANWRDGMIVEVKTDLA